MNGTRKLTGNIISLCNLLAVLVVPRRDGMIDSADFVNNIFLTYLAGPK